MTPRTLLLAAFAGSLSVSTAPARTWYVAADGSGDAPTIAAAVDSSVSGDVILVGPGTHFVVSIWGGGVSMKRGTSLVSEAGPSTTFLKPGSPPQTGLISGHDNCVISGFTVLGFGVIGTPPVGIVGDHVVVSNNIIHGASGHPAISVAGMFAWIHHNVCFADEAYGIYLVFNYFDGADIHNNIVLNGIEALGGPCDLSVQIQCNLINGSMSACPYRFYNFSADPMFCGAGNYYLQSDSPCAPGNHPDGIDCGLIGPLPVGCGPVSVQVKTWGSIKAMYRD